MMPYTYLIGWKIQDKYYYGVRYAKNCNPTELMINYFTSSKEVTKMIEQYGNPDIIQIRKTFSTIEKARSWEHKVLRRMKVVESSRWLNKTDNKSIFPMPGPLNAMYGKTGELSPRFGTSHSVETKRIIGEKSRKKRGKMPVGFSEKMRNIVLGRTHTAETKNKIKEALSGRTISEEHKKNISKNHADMSGYKNPFFGKKHSEEAKAIMREQRVGKKWIHNEISGQSKLVSESEVDTFINLGWTRGRSK